jgi:cystathionine gamma-lyase
MTPIYATSTYVQSSPGVHQGFEYSRSHNPTRFAWERCVAALEGGTAASPSPPGWRPPRPCSTLLDSGSHVICMDDVYGGTYRLFERVRRALGRARFQLRRPEPIRRARGRVRPKTKLIWIETPTNPMLKIVDIAAIARSRQAHGLLVAVDNTFASPMLQRPLEHGADIVMHSATKYLNGHSDMVGGMLVVGDDAELGEKIDLPAERGRRRAGAVRQLPRAARPEDAAPAHARALRECAWRWRSGWRAMPAIVDVIYPGLASHPQHDWRSGRWTASAASSRLRQGRPCRRDALHGALDLFAWPNRWAASRAWSTIRRS